jgi:putative NADH-flavin reductase
MKLAVFGATGGTGRQLVDQALAGGHTVTVLVRHPATFPLQHERLAVLQGDVRRPANVEAAVAGQDAIVSASGTNQRGPVSLCTDGVERILMAMHSSGVHRILVVSAYGAAESHHRNLYNFFVWASMKEKMLDKERMEDLLQHSDAQWTLVRPPALTNGPRTQHYATAPDLRISATSHISRADLADFMLRSIDDRNTVGKALTLKA